MKMAVLGYGGRGKVYCLISKVVAGLTVSAVCDNNPEKLSRAKSDNKLSDDMLFLDFDDMLKKGKVADVLFICTQDRQHYDHTMKALEAGYDIVLEKPVSPSPRECIEIEQKAIELGRKVAVCHVLRYTGIYNKTKETIDSGVLGDIVSIDMVENVGYWHQAHSFVRGDWRNSQASAPMILAKCCHDMDIAVFLTGSDCEWVSSFGELKYFKEENAPEGSANRCLDGCKVKEGCPYDAEKVYVNTFKKLPPGVRRFSWPQSRIVPDGVPTMEKITDAIKNGDFGRCVFKCDNDVVDYQSTQMRFENGINCSLIMTAFSNKIYREIRVRGTKGELLGDMLKNTLYYQPYGGKKKKIRLGGAIGGHGGGDIGLVRQLAKGNVSTDISRSIESHLMAMAAEESRLEDGKRVYIKEYKSRQIKP